ncbi:MAG TPA: phosphatidate cytidylyltransferase [Planctomycetaceae bacterium]|nr:phosphatidate cytidylyltransferase [Planctomycetaceae bacterium]
MRWRLILGPLMIVALAGVFYLDALAGRSAPLLLLLALAMGLRGTWELVDLLRVRSFEPQAGLVMLCTALVILSNWYGRVWTTADAHVRDVGALGPALLVFALAFLVLLMSEALRYQQPGRSMESLGAEVLAVAYVGILLSMTVQLRWVAGADAGYFALGSLVVAAKSGDIGAYFLGKFFGRRKLIERLSPGKTRMGARGAIVGAALGSLVWFEWVAPLFNRDWPRCPWYWALFFGAAIGVVGLMGDLCESLMKRDVGKKDSAPLLPSFGGLLDIIDSVIYAAPVAYVLWLVLPLGP